MNRARTQQHRVHLNPKPCDGDQYGDEKSGRERTPPVLLFRRLDAACFKATGEQRRHGRARRSVRRGHPQVERQQRRLEQEHAQEEQDRGAGQGLCLRVERRQARGEVGHVQGAGHAVEQGSREPQNGARAGRLSILRAHQARIPLATKFGSKVKK